MSDSKIEQSEWQCYLSGHDKESATIFTPIKGHHPNFFWRYMHFLMFGFKWVKNKDNTKEK